MGRFQFLTLCACAFVGCFFGGFFAQVSPAVARAQYQTFPGGNQPGGQVQIRSENTLFVPDGGLKMVNAQNRVLGVITDQGGNGGIVLLNSSGRPSVSILAGPNGFIDINSNTVRLGGSNGKEGLSLSATDTTSSLRLKNGINLSAADKGGSLFVNDAKGSTVLQMDGLSEGGRLVGLDTGKANMFELKSQGGEGVLSLFKKASEAGFKAHGTGAATITRDKETLWKIPSD